jgi:DNA-binding MarR family transcriptional regulator
VSGRELSDRDYRSLASFRYALRRFEAFSKGAARAVGLTPAQHQLLLAVRGHAEATPSTSDVAEMLQIKVHSATELVARAEANGLLERVVDPDDGRRAMLRLTPDGEAKLADLSVSHRAELRRFREEMNDVLRELG